MGAVHVELKNNFVVYLTLGVHFTSNLIFSLSVCWPFSLPSENSSQTNK